jgi:hypothetical protein
MIHDIRPYKLFCLLGTENHAHLVIPSVPGRESLTIFSLETLVLISAARVVEAKTILEVGTSCGWTSMHLAMNTEAFVFTLDIEDKPKAYAGEPCETRISQLLTTAPKFANARAGCRLDMVFIDGDHSYEGIKADTEAALRLNPKVVAWHDYSNADFPGVAKYLVEFEQGRRVFHIEDSWICLWFADDAVSRSLLA